MWGSQRLSTVARAVAGLVRRARLEWPFAIALFVPAAAGWVFLQLADEVLEGETHAADEAILLALRNPQDVSDPLGPLWLEEMIRDFSALGGVGVLTLLTLAVSGYLIVMGKRRAALAVLVAVGGGILLSTLAKAGFDRPRPDLVPHGSHVSTASFPSGHSMMAAVVYLTLAAMLVRIQPNWRGKGYILASAVIVVVLVGGSRVYLGVHWPTDVLAGWAAGACWAIGCWLVTLRLQRTGVVESEGEAGQEDAAVRRSDDRA